jgi:hypothetical protein
MPWWNPESWFDKPRQQGMATPATPKDPESNIKGLMKSLPIPGGQLGENYKLKQELLGSLKKGGKIKKTGIYRLHEGEEVIPKKKAMARKMSY